MLSKPSIGGIYIRSLPNSTLFTSTFPAINTDNSFGLSRCCYSFVRTSSFLSGYALYGFPKLDTRCSRRDFDSTPLTISRSQPVSLSKVGLPFFVETSACRLGLRPSWHPHCSTGMFRSQFARVYRPCLLSCLCHLHDFTILPFTRLEYDYR